MQFYATENCELHRGGVPETRGNDLFAVQCLSSCPLRNLWYIMLSRAQNKGVYCALKQKRTPWLSDALNSHRSIHKAFDLGLLCDLSCQRTSAMLSRYGPSTLT